MPRIAWIDEDIPVMMPVIQPLQRSGFHFDFYETIEQARSQMDAIRRADLLLLDILVPPGQNPVPGASRYTGIAFLKELASSGHVPPTIVFSVVNNNAALEDIRKLNVGTILRKPIRPSVLKDAVDDVLSELLVS